jgi:phage baseplate assembly protein W
MFYNIAVPLRDDAEGRNLLALNKTIKAGVKSELILLLLTQKGDRWMNPDYGTNLKKYLFEPNDAVTQEEIRNDIKLSVTSYLPRLTIESIEFKETVKDTQIQLDIVFSYGAEYYKELDSISLTIAA